MAKELELKEFMFGNGNEAPYPIFTKKTFLNMLTADSDDVSVGNVVFEPGSTCFWHTHNTQQVLLVTGGEGWYQEEGKEAQPLKEGDVVVVPTGVKHWHGASKDSYFAHISIMAKVPSADGPGEFFGPVNEEDYNNL